MDFPGVCLPPSTHKASSVVTAKRYLGAAVWKEMFKSWPKPNISDFLTIFHQTTS